ncbi:GNAT family N-acetyltransferase [Microvirga tunisiensis]|uniref:GNAT family N-acetyltransferase n=2 Tax=Pannonibacter tanglangensis TaxID=2750084 RepID=A0ABW9ZJQ1_9HYPH|nr:MULTISPECIES: GNAT family N-acetyltransferase [unclassified Pannonibacter]NBN64923.1 GNAT family N-acetyltransferase [Pannonibacter sp. XCT-34]NBN79426.1 GNAT family N-acetyltransferase [Pannonibacter sp. XCT-53]
MVVESEGYLDESSLSAAVMPQEGVRVRLDLPRTDDLADIVFLANNRKIASHLATMPHPFSLEDARRLVQRSQLVSAGHASFAIRMNATGRFIGQATWSALEPGGPVHVGYWLGEPFWGQGFATEALQRLVDHAFGQGEMRELLADCRVTNAASRRVLVKCGFQYRDQSMARSLGAGGSVPVERYGLERSVWLALKRWGRAA